MKQKQPLSVGQLAYQEYLKSSHWQKLKEAKRGTSAPPRCSICPNRFGLDLHHLFYRDRWEDTQANDLVWVCHICHFSIHKLLERGALSFPEPRNPELVFKITREAVLAFRTNGTKKKKDSKTFNGMTRHGAISHVVSRFRIPHKVLNEYLRTGNYEGLNKKRRKIIEELRDWLHDLAPPSQSPSS